MIQQVEKKQIISSNGEIVKPPLPLSEEEKAALDFDGSA
jgi:hypothetical protein